MKIRNKHLVRAAGWAATRFARGLVRTLRVEVRHLGPTYLPFEAVAPGERAAFALWHENLLLAAAKFGHPDLAVLISKHADGQLLGSLIRSMGMGMVEGSTNRGGVAAVREIVRGAAGRRHLVVTPDGPRGPRRVVQPGVVYAASRAGLSVVCVGIGSDRPWRIKSWDRFAVPKPCTRAKLVLSGPIHVPPKARTDELEAYRLRVQAEMDRVSAAAERWAETNRFVVPPQPDASPPAVRLAS